MKTLIELEEFLLANGWKEYHTFPPCAHERVRRLWCKPIITKSNCGSSNQPIDLCLDYIEFRIHPTERSGSIDVSIRGQVGNSIWYTLQAYSMDILQFIDNSKEIEHKLIASWEALQGEHNGI